MQYFIAAIAVMSCFSPFLDFELQFTALRKRSQTVTGYRRLWKAGRTQLSDALFWSGRLSVRLGVWACVWASGRAPWRLGVRLGVWASVWASERASGRLGVRLCVWACVAVIGVGSSFFV